jgi:small acid-soluble spore protein F (minor alpha/beta-type SASP)
MRSPEKGSHSPGASGASAASPAGTKPKTKKEKPLTPEDLYKLSVAEELGLGEKVRQVGWGGLTAAETGRVGGYMTRKAREKTDNLEQRSDK